jgi:spore germination cell wall hydrolase CwlJ-like protein
MSISIDNAFVKQFEREVFEAYQRMGSKLRPQVRSKNNVKGSSTTFQKVGAGTASTKSTHGMVPVMNLSHTAVEAVLYDYYAGDWIDNDIVQVCQKPFQFSCWNSNDPQRSKVIAVTERNIHFATCLRIARRAVHAVIEDRTGGATHYHTLDVYPHWAEGAKASAIIGHHIFYRLEA